jgi:hypothetical protein
VKASGRLTAIGLALAASALVALGLAPAGAAAANARQADRFVDSIGVAVHLGYEGTPYVEDFPLIEQRLGELGIRHVRTGYYPGARHTIDPYVEDLGARGVGSTLIMGSPAEPASALPEMLEAVKSDLLGSADGLEGPNEYSTSGDPEWAAHLRAYQQRLYELANADPALASLPVLGPSIVHNDQAALGDVSAYLDEGNIHSYPEGEAPQYKLEYFLKQAALNSASKPIVATETGYTNALNWTPSGPGEQKPISEAAAAVYMPRLYLEYWSRGIARTYAYQLVDEHPDPGLTNREEHFGLLQNNLSMKPAATAVENLTALLGDPGPSFTPGSLEYTLTGGTAKVKSALLEKRDGTFYLALWRFQSIWNPETKTAIAPAPEPLEVSFPADSVEYSVYEPTVSAAPVASGGPTRAATVDVGAGVTILKLAATPVSGTPGEPPPGETPPGETPPGETPVSEPPPSEPSPILTTPATTVVAPEATVIPPVSVLPLPTPPSCVVPALRGRTIPAAKKLVRRAGCTPYTVPIAVSLYKKQDRGTRRVTRTNPTAGTVLAAGAEVAVFSRLVRAKRTHR